jgi:rhamnosyltransferase subunit B
MSTRWSDQPRHASRKARVVLTTFGSLGDLHPLLALGQGLLARGHRPVIATSEQYRKHVEPLGLAFHPVRPDMPDLDHDHAVMRRLMDLRKGPEVVVREFAMPNLRASYDDTLAAADGADLLVSHPLTFATRLVAETKRLPWASVMLTPLGFFSAHDPPVLATAQPLAGLRFVGPAFHRGVFALLKWLTRSWVEPWHRLRTDLGLPPLKENPLFEAQHSPLLVLALFSDLLGQKQPDWPPRTVVTGFPFFDRPGEEMPPDLARFLDDGPPPIVFTLGSAAVHDAGPFYEHSARASAFLGKRAVLLTGKEPRNRPTSLPPGIAAFEYASYSEVFPRAAAIVHQGGVGTTAEAMRASRPMLVMPYSHDQPDNAARVARLGIARVVSRDRYSPALAAAELRQLLGNPRYAERASVVGRRVRGEPGIPAAVDAIEAALSPRGARPTHATL